MSDPSIHDEHRSIFHSRYDPYAEAERFAERSLGNRHPSAIVTVGAGLDYLGEALKKRLPDTLVASLQLSSEFRGFERPGSDIRRYPDDPIGVDAFLFTRLDASFDGGVAVLEWKPCVERFRTEYAETMSGVKSALDRLASERATIRHWGYRWLSNAARNACRVERTARLAARGNRPTLVVCAGLSSERVLDCVAALPAADRPAVVCVSSAAAACAARGVSPDLVVTTDPGFWGARHLDRLRAVTPVIVAPLTAALDSGNALPLLTLDGGLPYERDFASVLGHGGLPCPPSGTVAGTAILVAIETSVSGVFVTGLDLASNDIVSHARPNALDPFVAPRPARLEPAHSSVWIRETGLYPIRAGGFRFGRAHAAYAAELSGIRFGRLVTRCSSGAVPIPSMRDLDEDGFMDSLAGSLRVAGRDKPAFAFETAHPEPLRRERATAVVEAWLARSLSALETRSHDGTSDREGLAVAEALGGRRTAAFVADTSRGGTGAEYLDEAVAGVRDGARRLADGVSP